MTGRGPSSILPRSFRKNYPIAVRGEGAWLWDAGGRRYLDLAGSAAVNFIGHGEPFVANAVSEQLAGLEFVHSSQFTTPAAEDFAREVLAFAGSGFEGGAVFFTSGGSEAVETALKLARQYQVEIGEQSRVRFLSRQQAYHGATLGALSVSGNRMRREIYLPLVIDSLKVNTPYCYRCEYGCDDCATKYAAEVENVFAEYGSEIAAFIFEPVSGATIGAVVPPTGYLKRVADSCREHHVLLIADEVMTGCGRTGRNFAVDHWDVQPDILVAGKGIASGYAPLGAVIANRKVVDAIASGSGAVVHGFTYNAHPVALAAGRAVLDKISTEQLVSAAASDERHPGSLGTRMLAAMANLRECRSVGDIRGIGLLWAVEFVAERKAKTPFHPAQQFASTVARSAADRGVMTYPMQGCVDGIAGDHLLLAPPAVTQPSDIDWAIEQLKVSIREVENTL
jgi:adenosylmethionine-8-amino-7-oxononanoate aminotransferase